MALKPSRACGKEVNLAIILTALLVATGAHAQDYVDSTPCTQMAKAFDTDNKADILSSVQYVKNVFETLDENHVENGEPGVVGQWSDKAMVENASTVASWCQQHHQETIYNAAAEVYNGIRDLAIQFGVAK